MELIILVALMIVVSIIAYNVVKKKDNKPSLEKTMSIDPNSAAEQTEAHAASPNSLSQFYYKPCAMATTLRIVGVINGFGGIAFGLLCGGEFGTIIAIAIVFSGLMGCLFCFAFAKCVEAAHEYLNRF